MWWKKTCGMMGEWVVSPGPLEKIWGWTMMKYWFSVRWVDISWELRLGFREKYEVILWEKKVVVGVWEKKSCGWCLSESRLSTKYWKNVRSDFDDELVLNELVR